MIEIRKKKKLKLYADFSKLNRKTFMKIIDSDSRYTKKVVKPYEPKHPIRFKPKEIVHIHMDLKIFGRSEIQVIKLVYVFNMIDTSSRFVYSEVLHQVSSLNTQTALQNGYVF